MICLVKSALENMIRQINKVYKSEESYLICNTLIQYLNNMLLSDFHKNDLKQAIMVNHRQNYNKIKNLIMHRKFDAIDIKQVNKEKDLVIQHLNNCQNEQLMEQFEELSFYQEKYLILSKFLASRSQKGNLPIDSQEFNKFIHIFQENFQTQRDSQPNFSKSPEERMPRSVKPFQIEEKEQKKSIPLKINPQNNANLAPSQVLNQFFEKKQRQIKPIGFKNLIQKPENMENRNKSSFKKNKLPNRDVEVKKLLQQNKRLHLRLQKRSKQDVQLNEFQKNVLREQKERCMKRIQQLEEEVQDLAKDNYKLQQLSRQRSKKGVTTFINEDSVTSSKNELLPYYIPTRPNNLKLITQKNNLVRSENPNKDILLNLVDIPPIEKKQQYSFDEPHIQDNYKSKSPQMDNYVLEGLLDDDDENPQKRLFLNDKQLSSSKRGIFGDRSRGENFKQQINTNQRGLKSNVSNDSINQGNRFESFSMAKTAYYNSSLFLNASKNQVAMDSITSTRNKVAFFKNSLVIFKDRDYQIAFKKSSLDASYSQVRLIFYINNKTNLNQPVSIEYDYETTYYLLRVTEKLRNVYPNSQSRQVIEVDLMPKCSDLNSVMDVHFTIGSRKFDLWVPLCFIVWTSQSLIQTGEIRNMIIQPDRQFSNYQNSSKILPLSRLTKISTDQSQAYLFGRSRFGNHEVKLTWWQKQLTIDANTNILDFLGFIMYHFK